MPFSRGIVWMTLVKVFRNPFVVLVLLSSTFFLPVVILAGTSQPKAMLETNPADSYVYSLLLAMIVVSNSNPVGSWFSMGGRGDFLPLIITRPISRFSFVISKWLALTIILGGCSALHFIFLLLLGFATNLEWTPFMVVAGLLERILDAASVSAWFIFIFLLPSQFLVLVGLVILEIAAFAKVFLQFGTFRITTPGMVLLNELTNNLGISEWVKTAIFPILSVGDISSSLNTAWIITRWLGDFLSPRLPIYDLIGTDQIVLEPVLNYFFNVLLVLVLASLVMEKREFHYASE